jgi:hypothetical protein
MTTTMVEPEWDSQTRSAVLALDVYEAGLCPLCGRPSHICQAQDALFTADLPVRCHATTALLTAQDKADYDHERALLWSTREGPATEEQP